MQYWHQVKVPHIIIEDYRQVLEDYFRDRRKVPFKIKAVFRK